jgi:hypothetical protein
MKKVALSVVCAWAATVGLVALGAEVTRLSDTDVQAALSTASTKFSPLRLSEFVLDDVTGFRLVVYPPAVWIRSAATTAKRELRPFTLTDVTEEMRSNVWHMRVFPSTPTKINAGGTSVDHVVMRSKADATVLQPLTKEPFEDTVQNAFGAKATYSGVLATFDGKEVDELWGAKHDQPFLITVIGRGRKSDFEVKQKHFEQLR